jgi:uncharacterized membrane-anchored protein YhcB (DUF1043 family)
MTRSGALIIGLIVGAGLAALVTRNIDAQEEVQRDAVETALIQSIQHAASPTLWTDG